LQDLENGSDREPGAGTGKARSPAPTERQYQQQCKGVGMTESGQHVAEHAEKVCLLALQRREGREEQGGRPVALDNVNRGTEA
jgi:hypothetical protein